MAIQPTLSELQVQMAALTASVATISLQLQGLLAQQQQQKAHLVVVLPISEPKTTPASESASSNTTIVDLAGSSKRARNMFDETPERSAGPRTTQLLPRKSMTWKKRKKKPLKITETLSVECLNTQCELLGAAHMLFDKIPQTSFLFALSINQLRTGLQDDFLLQIKMEQINNEEDDKVVVQLVDKEEVDESEVNGDLFRRVGIGVESVGAYEASDIALKVFGEMPDSETEVHRLVVNRDPKFTNFVEFRTHKVIYRRYAGLFFSLCVDITDNELAYLECIHLFVEILDHFFSNVCELDLVFNFHKVYLILDEFILAGELQETSKKAIIERMGELEKLE